MSQAKRHLTTGSPETSKFLITRYQAMAFNASTIIGVGVLTLPRATTEQAHQFGWISVLIALLISLLGLMVIYDLNHRYPGQTIVEILQSLFGSTRLKWVGRLLSAPFVLLYLFYWCWSTGIVLRTFGEVVVTAVLVNTPLEVIVATMLLLCIMLAYYNVEVVVRVNEVLLGLIVVPVLFIALSSFQSAHLDFILPLFSMHRIGGVLQASLPAMTSLLGFEAMLMYNSHLSKEPRMMRWQLYGLLIAGLIYLLIVIAGIMSFGYEELSRQAWPTLELVKSTQVPGLVLERLEAVFLAVWVAAVFTSAGNWFFCANWSFRQFCRFKKRKWWSPPGLAVITYLIAMYPRNIEDLFHYLAYTSYFGLGTAFVMPFLFWVIALIRGGKRKKGEGGTPDARAAS
ncbi:GerAB/ArcD/ProY family transporter [Tumebacillus flagellatus]|uniref:Uncharacterized protein n=1 Tax=Tumebacillus flagellatus TaxID=1157490 RepID=A0A074LN34_9BACL|nr:endospore germination permease [Tumebacillus flagellatus]KEO82524.1 hypothetical protein EL26_14920 [Tumebacillus flagellatus]